METKPSQPDKVQAYLEPLAHPLKPVIEALCGIIRSTDPSIGEEVKWNSPAFFYAGPMAPSDPKKYERYLIVFNIHPKDHVMLVWPHGARIDDGSGFFEGTYADGRRLLRFRNLDDVKAQKTQLQAAIKQWLATLGK